MKLKVKKPLVLLGLLAVIAIVAVGCGAKQPSSPAEEGVVGVG